MTDLTMTVSPLSPGYVLIEGDLAAHGLTSNTTSGSYSLYLQAPGNCPSDVLTEARRISIEADKVKIVRQPRQTGPTHCAEYNRYRQMMRDSEGER